MLAVRPRCRAVAALQSRSGACLASKPNQHMHMPRKGMRPGQAQASADTSEGATPAASQSVATEQRPEGETTEKQKAPKQQPVKKEIIAKVDMLDIRVGQIVNVSQHPDADALYVEEIDIGEEEPRQIVSGLVKFVPVEEMQGRKVLVLANLKPAKLRGIVSSGMVLCASNEAHDKVEPVLVPEGVPVGERVSFEGFEGAPEAVLNPKKKLWEKIAVDLKTNAEGVAVYKDIPFMTSSGPVTSSLQNGKVS
ncbi:g657 [Coccomyxa viridis]|uniref:G657 protein n=1 Tax=Coccomyxa viridis TaxID=1274662 RepID=A0ABP1FGE4_9CHLO